MTAPRPTGEQQAIIDACRSGADLVIEAGAGTGKTSTLKMVAATQPRRRGLYVAYNKAIATDAKRSFPTSVTCATAHSLAFRAVGRRFAHRLNGPRMPARQTAKALGITRPLAIPHVGLLAPQQVARLNIRARSLQENRHCFPTRRPGSSPLRAAAMTVGLETRRNWATWAAEQVNSPAAMSSPKVVGAAS